MWVQIKKSLALGFRVKSNLGLLFLQTNGLLIKRVDLNCKMKQNANESKLIFGHYFPKKDK